MKQLTIKKNDVITHGPSQFPSEEELLAHLAKHEEMGSYGEDYEVLIEDAPSLEDQEANAHAKQFLADTDWYILREIDSGVPCPAEIKEARQAARDLIK